MPVRRIESKQNARLKQLRRALMAPDRGESGPAGTKLVSSRPVGIEGPNLIEEALRSGIKLNTVFVAQESERLLDSLPLPPETDILLLPRDLLVPALTTETPQPIAALIEPPDWTWAHLLASHQERSSLIIVLAGLQDPGNFGTIVRSAEAFGAAGIVSLPGTVSAWNPKAVRASAGSIFRLPMITADEQICFEKLREVGMKVLATTSRNADLDLDFDMTGPTALIIGNEGTGVPESLAARADARITISCPGPVESLNAAVAASLLMYEASLQRRPLAGGSYDRRGTRR